MLCSDIFAIFADVSRLDPDGRTVRETNEGTPCESATVTAAVCLGFFSVRVAGRSETFRNGCHWPLGREGFGAETSQKTGPARFDYSLRCMGR